MLNLESSDLDRYVEAIYAIWNNETYNSHIVRALLTYSDYAVETHYYTAYGKVYYFGKRGSWNRILTSDNNDKQKVIDALNSLLIDYIKLNDGTSNDKLRSIIERFESDDRDWRYYFIKYLEITSEKNGLNLYAWTDEQFDIQSLGNAGANPLLSYHVNPYILTLKERLMESKKFELWYGRYSNSVGCINIKGRVELRSCDKGWQISNVRNNKVTETLIKKYNLREDEDCFYLEETDKKDRIEIAKEFCEEILSL